MTLEDREDLPALLARVSLGDRAAFAGLYRRTSAHLLGLILRIQGDRAIAEDVLQEVFVKVWASAATYEADRAQPMAWMATIARHRAIDSLRRRRTEPAGVSTVRGADGDDVDLLDQLPSAQAGPLEALDQALDARALGRCMGELGADQRQCLALAYYQGLSHTEVAAQLVQPLGTVKSWVRRGLQALRTCLERIGQADIGRG